MVWYGTTVTRQKHRTRIIIIHHIGTIFARKKNGSLAILNNENRIFDKHQTLSCKSMTTGRGAFSCSKTPPYFYAIHNSFDRTVCYSLFIHCLLNKLIKMYSLYVVRTTVSLIRTQARPKDVVTGTNLRIITPLYLETYFPFDPPNNIVIKIITRVHRTCTFVG